MASKAAAGTMLGIVVVLIIIYGTCTDYAPPQLNNHVYAHFQDVQVMVFIGFGFLMSFLHRSGFTATGHAYFAAAFAALWTLLVRNFFEQAFAGEFHNIKLDTTQLIFADFGAAAVMISFGGLLGRVSALQLIVMTGLEIVFYSLNETILVSEYEVSDVGGSMVIHAFGAYFGVACSFVLEVSNNRRNEKSMKDNKPSNVTDTLAMVGTLFLFCFWPSFNSAPANQLMMIQERVVVNTYLAIFASCFTTFAIVGLVRKDGKFRMVEVQNATIAGGVAMGAAADFVVEPFGALLIGAIAATVSVLGYHYLTPVLEKKMGLKDTCGVHNLHGMPAIIGGLASVIAAAAADSDKYQTGFHFAREPKDQALYQAAGLATTLGIAIAGGAITGGLLRLLPPLEKFFDDSCEYETEDIEWGLLKGSGHEIELPHRRPTHSRSSTSSASSSKSS